MKKLSKLLPKKKNQPLVVVVLLLVIIGIVVAVIFTNNKKNNNSKSNNYVHKGLISNNMPVNNNTVADNNLSELEAKMNDEIVNNMARNDTVLEYDDELDMDSDNTYSRLCDSMIHFIKRLKENPNDYEKFKETSFYTPDFDNLYYLNNEALKNICLEEIRRHIPKDLDVSEKDMKKLMNTLADCLNNSSIDTIESCIRNKVMDKMVDIELKKQGINNIPNNQKQMVKNIALDKLNSNNIFF